MSVHYCFPLLRLPFGAYAESVSYFAAVIYRFYGTTTI